MFVKDGEWLPGSPEALRGWYIFVCCHSTRDKRCGICGPSVIIRFKVEIESRGLQGKVSVSPCSHIGGHKYAGNVIIFGPNTKKEVTGHWYVVNKSISSTIILAVKFCFYLTLKYDKQKRV